MTDLRYHPAPVPGVYSCNPDSSQPCCKQDLSFCSIIEQRKASLIPSRVQIAVAGVLLTILGSLRLLHRLPLQAVAQLTMQAIAKACKAAYGYLQKPLEQQACTASGP